MSASPAAPDRSRPDLPWRHSPEDPSATKDIRNRYGAGMYRRFRALKGAIRTGVVERDVFGLKGTTAEERAGPRGTMLARLALAAAHDLGVNPLGPPEDPERFADFDECVSAIMDPPDITREDAEEICGAWEQAANLGLAAHQDRTGGADPGIRIVAPTEEAYDFPSDPRKVQEFMDWLERQVDRGILEAAPGGPRVVAAAEPWQNIYIRQAYARGVQHADDILVSRGVIAPSQTVEAIFRNPFHADAAGLLYTRAYNELEGVTRAMSQQMSRVLANGLTQGHHPWKIASDLNDRVDKVGLTRARMISRTEVIRAHNEGALNRYSSLTQRLDGVELLAEWSTAGDNNVCLVCAALEGTTMTIREARGRIPIHPNCRCIWVPVPRQTARRSGLVAMVKRAYVRGDIGDEVLDDAIEMALQGHRAIPLDPEPRRATSEPTSAPAD